jgi:hypothetical protein
MSECLPQKFLREGGTLEQLQAKYHVLVKRGVKHPNLVLLKYHQIESPMGDPLVQQCRGLILDEARDWEIVSWPFDKFFNLGEGHARSIDWKSARVLEKLDGSLMQLYMYGGEWQVGTSGTPDGSGEVNGCGFTFAELFWRVWKELGYQLPDVEDAGTTFLFELMTPYNRVVVRHDQNRIALIGMRTTWGTELRIDGGAYNWELVRAFRIDSFAEAEKTFDKMDPLTQEGYVVVDADFNRVKVKHPGYVAIHHLRDGFGPKRILEVIRSGESSEVLTHFPEWTEAFNKVKDAYELLVKQLECDYVTIRDIPDQKTFALNAVKTRYSPALFQLRKGKVSSIRESLAQMQIKQLMELLAVKDMEL